MDSTAAKAIRVLERLAMSERPRGVTELALELDLPKSNIHRTLSTLASLGYVAREGNRYTATLRMWEIGVRVLNRVGAQRAAAPFIEELAVHSGETVHLAIRDGDAAVYVSIAEGTRADRTETRPGERVPLHATAVGKIFLAWAPPVALPRSLKRFTSETVTDAAQLLRELESIRRQGYALNRGEYLPGISGIAVPITGFNGLVVAAVALSAPKGRLGPTVIARNVSLMRTIASRISGELSKTLLFRHLEHKRRLD